MKNDGGPAFPQVRDKDTGQFPNVFGYQGMSLRDVFAQGALTGMNYAPSYLDDSDESVQWRNQFAKETASFAYAIADAMLEAKEEQENG